MWRESERVLSHLLIMSPERFVTLVQRVDTAEPEFRLFSSSKFSVVSLRPAFPRVVAAPTRLRGFWKHGEFHYLDGKAYIEYT